jgi:hypothetical protein
VKNAGGSSRNAFVRARQTCLWAVSHEGSDNAMASVSGDLAADDRDDFGIGALASPKQTSNSLSPPYNRESAVMCQVGT